jgi:methyltransferase (TIGR00027 family)
MRGASRTAVLVAALRARASSREDPICVDPWAKWLCGPDGEAMAERTLEFFPPAELWIALRTSFLDGFLRRRLKEGVDQVVILGAGLDTRAVRLQSPEVRFFEVDHPDTQAAKIEGLNALGDYPVEAATYVPCDFTHQTPVEQLIEAGMDPNRPTAVLWEGVVPYLDRGAVVATLSQLQAGLHGESVVAFDLVNKALVEGRSSMSSDAELVGMVDEVGEPFRYGVNDPMPLLVESGYRHVRTLSFDEICLEVTGSYERERAFRFQSVVLASRTRRLNF